MLATNAKSHACTCVALCTLFSVGVRVCVSSTALKGFCASVLIPGRGAGVISPAPKPQTSAAGGEGSILQVQAALLPWTAESYRLA